jgi:hypothetical protein
VKFKVGDRGQVKFTVTKVNDSGTYIIFDGGTLITDLYGEELAKAKRLVKKKRKDRPYL